MIPFSALQEQKPAADGHFLVQWLWYLSILVVMAIKNGRALARPGHFVRYAVLLV
jgi:hypothetical protein